MVGQPFQFPKARTPKARAAAPTVSVAKFPVERETVGLIQGATPASKEEWRVAMALERLKLAYEYQVPVWGGRSVRGGQMLDFLVYDPFPVPVPVNGEHWHKGQMDAEEAFLLAVVEEIYGRAPVILWANDLVSIEQAEATIRRELNL